MTSFVAPILERGLSAVALDAPGHGASGGNRSSVLTFAHALVAAGEAAGDLRGVIGHSMGAGAAAYAVGKLGLSAPRLVLIAGPADPKRYFIRFLKAVGVSESLHPTACRLFEERLGFAWADLFVPTLVRDARRPVLVVQDRHDAEVTTDEARAISGASPMAALRETSGLGHRRILRDLPTVMVAVDFIASAGELERAGLVTGHS